MNNLTTRKIVLGMLMTLVLAFSVQGIADALTLNPRISPSNFSTVTEGAEITVSGISGSLNNAGAEESVTIMATGGGLATFDPDSSWTEQITTLVTSLANDTGNGTITIPSSVKITVPSAGTVRVTVQWIPRDGSTRTIKSFTIYVVEPAHSLMNPTTALAADGVDYAYQGAEHQVNSAFSFNLTNAPTYYSVQGSGSLYVGSSNPRLRLANGALTSSSAPVYLRGHTGTSRITASVAGTTPLSVVYIYIDPSNVARYPRLEITNGDNQRGASGGRLEQHLEVKVTDGRGSAVSGVAVQFAAPATEAMFIPVRDTMVYGDATELAGSVADSVNGDVYLATPTDPPKKATPVFVQTDRGGLAKVYYEMGTDAMQTIQTITASLVGVTSSDFVSKSFTARLGTTGSTRVANLEIVSGNPQSAAKGQQLDTPLVVIARSTAGFRIPSVVIQFRTNTGILSREGLTGKPGENIVGTLNPDSGQQIYVVTGSDGQASVDYNIGQLTAAREVVAEVRRESLDPEYSFAIDRVTFNINGGGSTGQQNQQNQQNQQQATNTITISPAAPTGEPGDTETISVTSSPTGVLVTLSSTDFANTLFSPQSGLTPFTSTLTLPSSTGSYDIFAFGSINNATVSDSATVTVATTAPGSLTIEALGAPANGSQAVRVTVRESDGTLKSDDLSVTLTGPGISRAVETVGGTGAAAVTVPTATTSYTLTVSATGYTSGQITLSATTGQTGGSTPPPAGPVGVADSIEIDGSRQLSGTVDQAMRLRVRVLDANDNGVSDVRVTFRVLAPGRGTFAGARGNGRAVADQTDRNGYASANLTPSDDGDIIVRASAAGVSADVTFIIDVGEASADTETPTPSRDVTPSRDISPVVHVGVASRPPMLWVDGGAIYALVGASAQKFAPSVDNALNITVAGGKVYWTEKTGESAGTINSANLNGSGVTELTSILAVPMGIAVDTAGSKLYWTNSRGRIQSANLDGSRITNELQDLPSPMDIALGNGNVYWTQGNGSVRVVNLTGQKIVRDISTGSDTPGSLVIGGGKVYWTEKTGDSSGTVNSANLNGTGATQLASIRAVPMGIAVDGARSKLYWSNSRGRIQSADLDGSGITNVVSGLGSPGDMVLSNSITAPAATTATSTTTASRSKYDVNGDGTVDRFDALLVVSAFGTSNNKYDVNGDGTVNVKDYDLVFDEIVDAASAPPIVGIKLSAVQIDRIQEQIDLLIATNDRSPAAMRTLIYLQQLIVTARPEKTQLLANYPNPFNPETWIPYELATDTDVRLTIYNTQGVVIRTLQLGHQSAGYYTGRDRAAYWDGRNALGEQVASGLYFYQLETDEMSLMRKMVILK